MAETDASSVPTEPKTPAEANARLDVLGQDKAFASKLFSGDGATRRQFDELMKLKMADDPERISSVIAGTAKADPFETTTAANPVSTRNLMSAVQDLKQQGIPDDVLKQVLSDQRPKPEEIEAVRQLQAKRHGDADWRARFLKGDYEARREQVLMSIVLSMAER